MYSRTNLHESYQQNGVMTASPMELTLMLYEGAIKNLKIAMIHIENRDYEKANNASVKAQNIIAELANALDLQYPISKELLAIYDFMLNEIIAANTKKDRQIILPVIGLLEELRDTWKQVKSTNGHVAMSADII